MSVPVVCRDAGICRGGGMRGLHLLTYFPPPSPPASSEFVHIRICEWGSCEVVYVLYSAGDWGLGTGDWMGWGMQCCPTAACEHKRTIPKAPNG